jgi:hypothetical protein
MIRMTRAEMVLAWLGAKINSLNLLRKGLCITIRIVNGCSLCQERI